MPLMNTENNTLHQQQNSDQIENQKQSKKIMRPDNQQLFEEFYDFVKSNEWLEAKGQVSDVLKKLQSQIEQNMSKPLTAEQQQAIKNAVRVGYYFDELNPDGEFKWLNGYVREIYLDFKKNPAELDIQRLHRVLDFVRFELRRDVSDFEHCFQIINEVTEIVETSEKEIAENSNEAEINSFQSRLNYIRYEIALKRQERYEAAKYLDLSENFLTLHARAQTKIDSEKATSLEDLKIVSEKAQNILYLQTARIVISKVFLLIGSGRYEHAINLQNLIEPTLKGKKSDPRALLRNAIANSICRRCLHANDKKELRDVSTIIETILKDKIYKDNLSRLLLRLQYEYSLMLLLRIGLEPDQTPKLLKELNKNIEIMRPQRPGDPAWAAQIAILDARSKQHNGEIEAAEIAANNAIKHIENTPFKLLQVEARAAKAVVLLRQDKPEKYNEAIELLNEAQELNKERGLISNSTEFTQPELAALCFLYLARIYIRKKEKVSAVNNFDNYQNICSRIEHGWILERLAPAVEREIILGFIGDTKQQQESYNLTAQTQAARKRAIEQASRELQTSRTVPIAKRLDITPQTLYSWMRELEATGFIVELHHNGKTTANESLKQVRLKQQKEEIERASRILGTTNKAKIADFLEISRQTLYNRLNELKKSDYAPEINFQIGSGAFNKT